MTPAEAGRRRARTRRVVASAALASSLLMVGHAISGSAENDATEEVSASDSLVQQALALGLITEDDLAPAAVDAVTAAPTVASILPNAGPLVGGQIIAITGTNFSSVTGADGVTIGEVNATSYAVVSATRIVAAVPNGATAGAKAVKVKNGDGTNSNTINYTYGAPTVTGVVAEFANPNATTSAVVTITGTGFTGAVAADVKFGDNAAPRIWVVSDTQIVAETPIDIPDGPDGDTDPDLDVEEGLVEVVVTRNSVSSPLSAKSKFLLTESAPTVTSLSGSGTNLVSVGADLTITGTKLWGVSKVNFGTTAVTTGITVNPAGTELTVKVPARTGAGASGPQQVTVQNVAGTSATNLSTVFNYIPTTAPTIASVNPNVLNKAAGGSFLVTGTGFTGAVVGKITVTCDPGGAVTPSSVVAVSDTQLIITLPANTGNAAATCDLKVEHATNATLSATSVGALRYV